MCAHGRLSCACARGRLPGCTDAVAGYGSRPRRLHPAATSPRQAASAPRALAVSASSVVGRAGPPPPRAAPGRFRLGPPLPRHAVARPGTLRSRAGSSASAPACSARARPAPSPPYRPASRLLLLTSSPPVGRRARAGHLHCWPGLLLREEAKRIRGRERKEKEINKKRKERKE